MEALLRKTFLVMSENRGMHRFVVGNGLTRKMSRRFIAGEMLDEALGSIRELNAKGILATLDLLGESVESESEARQAGADYEAILDRLAESGLKANVSLKPTQMGMDLGDAFCREIIAKVVAKAKSHGNFVRIDMEGSAYTQRTLDMFKDLLAEYGRDHVGIVLQAYLYRTEADVEEMIRLGARVRLCKGAYKEPAEVAFPEKADVDANYVKLAKRLVKDGHYPGLATHHEPMIQAVKDYVAAEGIGRERFEFQILYGIRRDLQESLVQEGFNMRCYVPYGTQWYPYFMRRLAERPANVWFIMSNMLK
ncbi:Proline dehydrogenase 1 [compost metagenome]